MSEFIIIAQISNVNQQMLLQRSVEIDKMFEHILPARVTSRPYSLCVNDMYGCIDEYPYTEGAMYMRKIQGSLRNFQFNYDRLPLNKDLRKRKLCHLSKQLQQFDCAHYVPTSMRIEVRVGSKDMVAGWVRSLPLDDKAWLDRMYGVPFGAAYVCEIVHEWIYLLNE